MRRLATVLLLLASCGRPPTWVAPDERIGCGPIGSLAPVCTVERNRDVLVVRKPDGGFRRFKILGDDAAALVAADGAEHVRTTIRSDGTTEIEVGGDHYVFPPGFATR